MVNASLTIASYRDKWRQIASEVNMILRIVAASLLALGLGLMAENAQAAQTFICNDGRLLQVELHQLERM